MRYKVTLSVQDAIDIIESEFETNKRVKLVNYKPIEIEFEVD